MTWYALPDADMNSYEEMCDRFKSENFDWNTRSQQEFAGAFEQLPQKIKDQCSQQDKKECAQEDAATKKPSGCLTGLTKWFKQKIHPRQLVRLKSLLDDFELQMAFVKCEKVELGAMPQGCVTCWVPLDHCKKVAFGRSDGHVKIYDFETGDCLHTLKGHSGYISCLDTLESESKILTGCSAGAIKIWDFETGQCLQTINQKGFVTHCTYVDGGRTLISGDWTSGSGGINVWDAKTGCRVKSLKHNQSVTLVEVDAGNKILSASRNSIKLWDMKSGKCLTTYRPRVWTRSFTKSVWCCAALNRDPKWFAGCPYPIMMWSCT